jgi:resuscitation-promoting factor RpfB
MHIRGALASAIMFVITSVGAGFAQGCDENYGGVCVPVASDVDCAGGSGNGPAYVTGPVYVIGTDVYGLDRDGDGVACEPK